MGLFTLVTAATLFWLWFARDVYIRINFGRKIENTHPKIDAWISGVQIVMISIFILFSPLTPVMITILLALGASSIHFNRNYLPYQIRVLAKEGIPDYKSRRLQQNHNEAYDKLLLPQNQKADEE